jgi:hypothetical protein
MDRGGDPTDAELKGLSGMHSLSAVRWQTDPHDREGSP